MKNMTMLILSCDKFSDLWDGHIKLLEQNWPDRDMTTYIVTDSPSDKHYPNIEILSAGTEVEWSDRLAYALKHVDTDYVFITLDDYFLIKNVDDQSIASLMDMMEKENIDYVRLFPKPERATKNELTGYSGIYQVDNNIQYCVNLYSGVWKKSFLESTCKTPETAWRYEVSLSKCARDYGAMCAVSSRNEFVILDVVRKGKLLHKAAKYFRMHPGIYKGDRQINTWKYEMTLGFQIFMADHLPLWAHKPAKKIMNLFGKSFFSDAAE